MDPKQLHEMEEELHKANDRNQMSRHTRHLIARILTIVAVSLVAVAVIGMILVTVLVTTGKSSLSKKSKTTAPTMSIAESTVEEVEEPIPQHVWKEGWIRYNGKVYEYNENMLTFLFMGIDKKDKVKAAKNDTDGGQADAIFLATMNPDDKSVKLIGINRDTKVDLVLPGMGENGEDITYPGEIAAQHGFGGGLEKSCELTRDAVSGLFYDLPIHGYLSYNLGGLIELNDALGGVTLTVMEDLTKVNKNLKLGEEITLMGQDAYTYIQYRDYHQFETARGRLARQKQYISCLGNKMKEKLKEDITFPIAIFQKLQPYIVTDLELNEITWLTTELINYGFDSDIYTLEGETKEEQVGKEVHEMFYPDKESLKNIMIEVFYKEVDMD